jgi:hypothetical protein
MAAEDEDRHAVVVIAAPATRWLESSSAGDDGAGGHQLVEHMAVDARRASGNAVSLGIRIREEPIVQAFAAISEPVVKSFVGPRDEAVEGHRHGENGCGHGASFFPGVLSG